MCVDIHLGVADTAEAFFNELRRKYYVTPKSYLDLIQLYITLLRETRHVSLWEYSCFHENSVFALHICALTRPSLTHTYPNTLTHTHTQEMAMAHERLLNGLDKLQETNVVVDRMQQELSELQPILAEKTKDTQELLVQVCICAFIYALFVCLFCMRCHCRCVVIMVDVLKHQTC